MMRMGNSGSLHYAPPDFLWSLVASSHFMRPSLRKGAYAACLVMRGRKSGYAPVGMTLLFGTDEGRSGNGVP
jgi:hypothetical protein